ncbi:acyl-CoA dehydrogenase [Actinocrinis sp.]|uniref:acyl-CoA dehydrogenase family protein n=1 Tax=Actinocrinis sp. TaxID=1920516 RepID=UPI002D6D4FA4|nr:acyl-CoA dehydrogenase [Actinocrinis sp.]HZP51611.1 acyl-CoA dehydrogenase [Actinocrinis sp.]
MGAAVRYQPAEELEARLGDPWDPDTEFSYARCAQLDEREEFPAAICAQLDAWGVPGYYVPVQHGGRLDDYEQLVQLMRVVARRDLTVAIGHGKTYLGGVCMWVAGAKRQADTLGAQIRAGVPVSLGLTEQAHGSDLIGGEVAAVPDGRGGLLVSGEKWLINNATRGGMLAVLVRTDPAGGPRGFSMLLVDKRKLAQGTYQYVDKIHTLGIRGADISGIRFDAALVPESEIIGVKGGGIETILKALQLTRTMCTALSLGAADHALRLVLDFNRERRLYGRTLIELPKTRSVLATAAADVLISEALSIVAARAVHVLTEEMSVVSAVAKYLVPTSTEMVIADLTRQLGARAYLKEVYAHGMFQKVDRDHRIVGLFDGNTLVNLNSIVNQFRTLVRTYRRGAGDTAGAVAAFDLSAPLPPVDPARLSLIARAGSGVLATLPDSVAALRDAADQDPALKGAVASAERLAEAVDRVHDEMESHQNALADVSPQAFETARRYTLCFAAAACLGLWAHNHNALPTEKEQGPEGAQRPEGAQGSDAAGLGRVWRDGVWLRAALDRLLVRLGEPGGVDSRGAASSGGDGAAYEQLLSDLCAARDEGELFSLLPLRLAGRREEPQNTAEGMPC